MKNFFRDFGIYFLLFAAVVVGATLTQSTVKSKKIEDKSYTDVVNAINNGEVAKLQIYNNDTGLNVTVKAYIKATEEEIKKAEDEKEDETLKTEFQKLFENFKKDIKNNTIKANDDSVNVDTLNNDNNVITNIEKEALDNKQITDIKTDKNAITNTNVLVKTDDVEEKDVENNTDDNQVVIGMSKDNKENKDKNKDKDEDKNISKIYKVTVADVRTFQAEIDKAIIKYPDMQVETKVVESYDWLLSLIPTIVMAVLAFVIISMFIGQVGGGNKMNNFGKSKAKRYNEELKKVNFKKVAGLKEEKEELTEIVEFLKNPKKFIDMGARIPKGVLLVGPPGTGKTLLGKAVAGEAGVPFFSISGSDFVEMFVGVGASRVRDLFEEAKKNSPCIVFIDEIDAVGRKRGAGLGGGHDEREQTLNQLLVEMDGFGANQGVIVLAATNRADILDKALTRPGRFDRTVYVGKPDVKGREQILKVHAANKPVADSVNYEVIAKTTAGFTGADLENLMNEAAIIAAKRNKKAIDMKDIGKAFVKVGIGTEKKSRVISEKEKMTTAYHEAGHAILHYVLPEIDPVHSISIIPTGFAGGYTMPLPTEDRMTLSQKYMEQQICSLLGGRIAEQIKIGDITTGASNDIERATQIAREMVTKYGMSKKLGPVNYDVEANEVFIGRDLGKTKSYGEDIARVIDEEIRRIVEEQYALAEKLLRENDNALEKTCIELVKREKITGDEFDKIMRGEELPEFIMEDIADDDDDIFEEDKQISLFDLDNDITNNDEKAEEDNKDNN